MDKHQGGKSHYNILPSYSIPIIVLLLIIAYFLIPYDIIIGFVVLEILGIILIFRYLGLKDRGKIIKLLCYFGVIFLGVILLCGKSELDTHKTESRLYVAVIRINFPSTIKLVSKNFTPGSVDFTDYYSFGYSTSNDLSTSNQLVETSLEKAGYNIGDDTYIAPANYIGVPSTSASYSIRASGSGITINVTIYKNNVSLRASPTELP